jgi:hypothetical protein
MSQTSPFSVVRALSLATVEQLAGLSTGRGFAMASAA